MRYKLLGNSGLRVSEICLGTMSFGEDFGWGISEIESRQIFDAFVEAGGNFIDTANEIYNGGSSEKFLGEFIATNRDRIVLSTKYTDSLPTTDPNLAGNQRKNMVQSLERSLKRLKTDYIDLFWLHSWDFVTPIEEIMRAFDDLVRSGKVLYIGIADAPAWVISRANTIAELRGWTPFIATQIEYSLVERTAERELLPMAQELNIGIIAWSVLASGILLKENTLNGQLPLDELTNSEFAIASLVQKIAQETNRSPAQVAINWVRSKGIIPILGANKLSQLQTDLACLDFQLSTEHLKALDDASTIELGFPHDFLAITKESTFGGMFNLIGDRASS
ncbi:aldo/keto reductase [Synechocystis sp. PCC 7509]|uniref:aldo/keto reductase n=1 Tax=Synechocystis sp. PCC 7509 TaxID=927677 RepID=UPI0002ACD95D|nr:aldo/keto reductase [Synechocystis sp. PCC 7509]